MSKIYTNISYFMKFVVQTSITEMVAHLLKVATHGQTDRRTDKRAYRRMNAMYYSLAVKKKSTLIQLSTKSVFYNITYFWIW